MKLRFWRRALTVGAALLAAGLATAPAARAAVRIEPLSAEIRARPGQQFSFPLQVTNLSNTEPTAVDFGLTDVAETATGRSFPAAGSTAYSLLEWLTLPPRLQLAGGESRQLSLEGRVPPSARGTRHGAVMIIPVTPASAPGGGAQVTMVIRVAYLVDLTIPGTGRSDLSVEGLDLIPALETAGAMTPGDILEQLAGKLAVRVRLRNQGDSGDRVHGWVYLRDGRSRRIVQRLPLGGERGVRALPQSPAGSQTVLPQAVPPGPYLLELEARYGDRNQRLRASQAFEVSSPTEIAAVGEFGAESEYYRLTLSQDRVEAPLRAGIATTRSLQVRNEESIPLECSVEVLNFRVEPDGTLTEEPAESAPPVTVTPQQFTLPPRAATSLRVQVTPSDSLAPEREHYWLVRITGRGATGGAVALATALVVAADPQRVQPAAPQLAPPSVQQGLDTTTFTLLISNPGGRAWPVAGTLTVREAEAEQPLGVLPLTSEEGVSLLAGGERQFSLALAQPMKDKAWVCALSLSLARGQDPAQFAFTVNPAPPPEAPPPGAPAAP